MLALGAASPAGAGSGSAARGEVLYRKHCLVCHAIEPEFHKEGPSLAGVYDRRAGTAPFFAYKALKGSTAVWTDANLDAWLADPRAFLQGRDTGMTLKVDNPAERADLIAYLRTL